MTEVLLFVLIVVGVVVAVFLWALMRRINRVTLLAVTVDLEKSLKSITDSLALAADLAKNVATDLKLNVAEARQQFSRLVVLIDELQQQVNAQTMEAARVATDLKEVQDHAKGMETSTPGAVADSAATGTKADPPNAKRTRPKKV